MKINFILGLIYSKDLTMVQQPLPHLHNFKHPAVPNTFLGQNGTLLSFVNILEQNIDGHFLTIKS